MARRRDGSKGGATAIEVADPDFREAIRMIDDGDCENLATLLDAKPHLPVRTVPMADEGAGGHFSNPKPIWFTADNPVRNDRLPANITNVVETQTGAGANADRAVKAALGHRETAAVEALLRCGAAMTLQLAVGLGLAGDGQGAHRGRALGGDT